MKGKIGPPNRMRRWAQFGRHFERQGKIQKRQKPETPSSIMNELSGQIGVTTCVTRRILNLCDIASSVERH